MVPTIYLVHRPILWLLGWVCRMTVRHRMMWFSATICLIVYLAFVVSWEYLNLVPNYSLATFLPSMILPFVLLWPVIDGPSTLVREQRWGDRRIVLVLMPAEGVDVGTR